MFQTEAVEKIKTRILVQQLFSKIVPWKNTVQPDRPLITI
jgi:hypothetical protein